MDLDAARVIAYSLKQPMSAIRHYIDDWEGAGVHVRYVATTEELCPCGYHYATESGLCVRCETQRELERQTERDADEERRLEQLTTRRVNAVKKARERMRKRFLANPRDKEAKAKLAMCDEIIAEFEEADHEDFDE